MDTGSPVHCQTIQATLTLYSSSRLKHCLNVMWAEAGPNSQEVFPGVEYVKKTVIGWVMWCYVS